MTEASLNNLAEPFRWAMEDVMDASTASADWLAQDIDPRHRSATNLLTDPTTPLEALAEAKEVFKTMRIMGETVSDRRLAARLYLAAIAAALLHHEQRISSQSDAALRRNLRSMQEDESVPESLRQLAKAALAKV